MQDGSQSNPHHSWARSSAMRCTVCAASCMQTEGQAGTVFPRACPRQVAKQPSTQKAAAACTHPAHLRDALCSGVCLPKQAQPGSITWPQCALTQPTWGMGCAMGFFSASRTAACESGSGQQCGCTPMACSSISMASQLQKEWNDQIDVI